MYAFLDLYDTLSFVIRYVAIRFNVSLQVLFEPFSIYTLIRDSLVSKRVYRRCPLSLSNIVTLMDLVKLHMLDFYVILCMNWLHACFASIHHRTQVVRLHFLNETILERKGEIICLRVNMYLVLMVET